MTADGYLTQSSFAANGDTVAVAWVENSQRIGPEKGLYVVISRDRGRSFGAPVLAAAGLFPEPPTVAVAPDGSVALAYVSGEGDLSARDVYVRRLAP
jgi:hypothetical protein